MDRTSSRPADSSLLGDLARFEPAALDLRDPGHEQAVTALADRLRGLDEQALAALESASAARRDEVPVGAHLAVKLALSSTRMAALPRPFHLSVVFAAYREHTRILTRSEHLHGEDFLRRKVGQLEWLFAGERDATWDLTLVDDGCPEGSGTLAREIAEREGYGERVRVLFLADAIAEGLAVASGLKSPADSRKGGSVLYGMWAAARTPRPGQVVLFTDADLSTHLGQSGLLLAPILQGGRDLAIGSRREPLSIALKQGRRNLRGKLFIYLWKRMLGVLGDVVDTQCGFKAFSGDAARALVEGIAEKGFAFDIELLLAAALRREDAIERVPIAWIDSEDASTTTDLQPYLTMLRAVVRMYRTYLPSDPTSEPFARLIESLDEDSWQDLVDALPVSIAEREPATFGGWDGVAAEDLAALLGRAP